MIMFTFVYTNFSMVFSTFRLRIGNRWSKFYPECWEYPIVLLGALTQKDYNLEWIYLSIFITFSSTYAHNYVGWAVTSTKF